MKVLALAAHPDDEVLGCWSTLEKHQEAGDTVLVEIISKGRDDKIDQMMDTVPVKDLADRIHKVITKYRPDIVYTHNKHDINQDHRRVHEATLIACRGAWVAQQIYAYEVATLSQAPGFTPNHYVRVSRDYIERKIAYMQSQYQGELKVFPHPRSPEGIMRLAKYRGFEVQSDCAEAFEVIRSIK